MIMSVLTLHSLNYVRSIKRSALPLQNQQVKTIYYNCLKELKISHPVSVYSTAFLKSPDLIGIIFFCFFLSEKKIAFSWIFPKVYDTTEQVRGYGQKFIVITALFFPIQGLLNSLYFTLRSGGKTVITFLFDSVFSWVVTVPVAAVLSLTTPLSVFVIYAIVQSLDLIKVAIGYGLIRKGIWISTIVD